MNSLPPLLCASLSRALFSGAALLALTATAPGQVVVSEWNTGSGNWNAVGNWTPADVPDNGGTATYSVQIGNRAVAAGAIVVFIPEDGVTDTVGSLTLTNGVSFDTNAYNLTVNNNTALTGTVAGTLTTLRVLANAAPAVPGFNTATLQVNSNGRLLMTGGKLQASGLLEINASGMLAGYGTVACGDIDATVERMLENSGTIAPSGNAFTPGSLTIEPTLLDSVDLDGDTETGVLNVSNAVANTNQDTLTLTVNAPVSDPFSSGLFIGQRDSVIFNKDFALAGAGVVMNGGTATATLGGTGKATSITGTSFNLTGHTVINNDLTFSGTANSMTFAAGTTAEFNGWTKVPDAGLLASTGAGATIVVGRVFEIPGPVSPAFDFDARNWVLKPGGHLNIGIGGPSTPGSPVTFTGSTISMDGGTVNYLTNASILIFDSTLTAHGPSQWIGTDFQLGDDSGSLTAKLDITGLGGLMMGSDMYFKSDADVHIGPGSSLYMSYATTFQSVNGANQMRFRGEAGSFLGFDGPQTFLEDTTIDMPGGTVVLDGDYENSAYTAMQARVVINAGVMEPIGQPQPDDPYVHNLQIFDNAPSLHGSLTVNLPLPTDMWTARPNSSILLSGAAGQGHTLLAGNGLVLQGALTAIGDVRTAARLQMSSEAKVHMRTSDASNNPILRLNGGDAALNPNTMAGAVIGAPEPLTTSSVPGTLAADAGRALTGWGTIHSVVAFDPGASLLADNGILTLADPNIKSGTLGTAGPGGTLQVTKPWDSAGIGVIPLKGGLLTGDTLTLKNTAGLTGYGTADCRILNDTVIEAAGGNLILLNNTNDPDGSSDAGMLRAGTGSMLEMHAQNGTVFHGAAAASGGGKVYFRDFTGTIAAGGRITLQGAVFQANLGLNCNGEVSTAAGVASTLEAGPLLTLGAPATVSLAADLVLDADVVQIASGVVCSGTGKLIVPPGTTMQVQAGGSVNVTVDNQGAFEIADGLPGSSSAAVKEYHQSAAASVALGISGPADYESLAVKSDAHLDGTLVLSLQNGFQPVPGQTFDVLKTDGAVTGTFTSIAQPPDVPVGLLFTVSYLPNTVRLTVNGATPFDAWVHSFPGLNGRGDHARTADPDHDGDDNFSEFAFDGDPASGLASGKVRAALTTVAGRPQFLLTIPVRTGAVPDERDAPGGALALRMGDGSVRYTIQATEDFLAWRLDVTEVTGPPATTAAQGLPPLHAGWEYRTFSAPENSRIYWQAAAGE